MTMTVFRASLLIASALSSGSVALARTTESTAATTEPLSGAARASDNAPAIDEIIVTAQKRNERLQDVPLSITAASGEQLAKQGITGPADLAKIAPGFTYRLSQNGTPVFAIRGIGLYSEQVAAAPTVTIYTDQIPLPYARMTNGAGLDVERVEVLKGPQGTLFGQNSTGGAVNYIAAKPTSTLSAGVNLTYGRFDQVGAEAYLSGPVTEKLTFRIAARRDYRDDWQVNNVRNDTSGKRDFSVGRLLVDWRPTERLFVELNLNGWMDRSDTQHTQARGYLPLAPTPPLTPQAQATFNALSNYPYYTGTNSRIVDWDPGVDYSRDDNFYQAAATVRYDVTDNLRLVSISAYSNLKTRANIDVDGTFFTALALTQIGRIESFSQELRLEGDTDRLKWVIGGNYGRDSADEAQPTITRGANTQIVLPPPFPVLSFDGTVSYNDQRITTKAVFGNVDYRLTDTLSAQIGLRYTKEDRDFSGCLADNGTPTGLGAVLGFPLNTPRRCITILPNGSTGEFKDSLNQDNLSWRGSINYKPSNDLLVYANVTKGFKSGVFGTLPAISFEAFQPAVQESVIAYETGVKASLFDRAVDVSGAIFYNDYRNKQSQGFIFVPQFGNLPYLINLPKSRVYGAEVNLALRPVRGLRITAGGTYLNTRVKGAAPVVSPFGQSIDADGERLPNAPEWQMQSDAEYTFPLGGDLSGFIGASFSYRTATDAQPGARTGPPGTQDFFRIDGFGLLDLRAGVNVGEGTSIQVWGRNVTNKGYWNNVVHIYDTYSRVTGEPVTYGVTVSSRF